MKHIRVNLSYRVLLTIVVVLSALILFLIRIRENPIPATAGWWDDTWHYRQSIGITAGSAAVTDFQIKIEDVGTSALVVAAKLQSDCGDLRFTSAAGQPLPYWIESGCNTTATDIWVKVDSIPASGGTTIYMYYGNPSADDGSNGTDVFPSFFDAFVGTTINSNTYTYGGGGTISQNEYVSLVNNADAWDTYFYGTTTYSRDSTLVFQANFKADSGTRSMIGWHDNGSGASYADLVYAIYFNNGTFNVYEDSNNRAVTGHTYTVGTWYQIKIELESTGAKYYYKTLSATSWTLLYDSAYSTESNLRPGVAHYDVTENSHTDDWLFRQYLTTDPTVSTPASEEKATSPLAHWSFDEGVGTTAYDEMRRYHGTFLSVPAWIDGAKANSNQKPLGKALKFDNVDDGVSIGTSFAGLVNYTMSAWIYPMGNHKNYDGAIISSGNWNNDHWSFGIGQSNTTFKLRKWDGVNSNTTSYTFPLNTWTHVAIARNGSSLTYYVNGLSYSTISGGTGPLISNAANTTVGRETYAGGYFDFNGAIDEVKVYDQALTANQVKIEYNRSAGVALGVGQKPGVGATGPVAHWKFDEGVGTTAYDTSGNSNNGSFGPGSSAPTWTIGKIGKALDLDGNDYLDITGLTSTSQSYTFETWAKSSLADSTTDYLFDFQTGRLVIGWFTDTSGKIGFYDGAWKSFTDTPNDNNWHHLAFTFDSGTTKATLFIDGSQIGTTNYTPLNLGGSAKIGSYYNGNSLHFNGSLDNIKIYNYARTVDQIHYDMGGSPISYWRFDEGVGTTAYDEMKNNHGILGTGNSSPTWTSGAQPNLNQQFLGKSLSFDGNDYISAGTNPVTGSSPFTISSWLKIGTTSTYALAFSIGNAASAQSAYLGWVAAAQVGTSNSIGGGLYGSNWGSGINGNDWHHVALTFSGGASGTAIIYVDGIPKVNTTTTPNLASTAITFGKANTGTAYWYNGQIDEPKVYNYALTAAEIAQDYNRGNAVSLGVGVGTTATGLMGWWKLDEGVGSTAYDTGSTNAYNVGATNFESTDWTPGQFGKSFEFDGNNECFLAPADNVGPHPDTISISLWVYPTATTANFLLGFGDVTLGSYNYYIYNNSGAIRFTYGGVGSTNTDQYQTSSAVLTTNAWNHLVITFTYGTGSSMEMYLNSIPVSGSWIQGTGSRAKFTSAGSRFSIGSLHVSSSGTPPCYGTSSFTGKIDNVKIFSGALSQTQVSAEYNQGQPIAHWRLDEGVGTTAYDDSDNNNDGVFGAGTSAPTWVSGKFGNAVDFDGSNDRIDVPDNDSLSFGNSSQDRPFTISAWINMDDATYFRILSKGSDPYPEYAFHTTSVSDDLLEIALYDNSVLSAIYTRAITPLTSYEGTWTHVAATYDGSGVPSGLNLYINGVLIPSTDATVGSYTAMHNQTTDLTIGKYYYAGAGFHANGKIDELKIYNYALSADQIKVDYNNSAAVRLNN